MKDYFYNENFKENDKLYFPAYVLKVKRHPKFSLVSLRYKLNTVTAALRPEICSADTKLLTEGVYADIHCTALREFRAKNGLELNITDFKILSSAAVFPDVSAMDTVVSVEEEITDKNRFLLRGNLNNIYRCRNIVVDAFREFMKSNDFFEADTPVIQPAAERQSFKLDWFGKTAYLAASPQLALTPCTAAFERVYQVSHSFSAKRRGSQSYINEFTAMNFQIGYIEGMQDVADTASRLIKDIMKALNRGGFSAEIPKDIPVVTLCEALKITDSRSGLNPTQAKKLCGYIKENTGCDFVFVSGFADKDGKFYVREKDGYAQRFDIYFKGIKIGSGSENIYDFSELDKEEAQKYPVYFNAVKYGIMPYGGAAIGIERFVMSFLELSNIRRAAIFPRDVRNIEP